MHTYIARNLHNNVGRGKVVKLGKGSYKGLTTLNFK